MNTCNCVRTKFIFNELYKQKGTRANPEAVNRLADLTRQRPGFSARPAFVGFGLGQLLLPSPVSVIPPPLLVLSSVIGAV